MNSEYPNLMRHIAGCIKAGTGVEVSLHAATKAGPDRIVISFTWEAQGKLMRNGVEVSPRAFSDTETLPLNAETVVSAISAKVRETLN